MKSSSNIPIAQQNLAGLIVFSAAILIVFSLFYISPWSKQKIITVSGTKNALPEDVKVASGILDTDYISYVFLNQNKVARTVEKTNVWIKKANVTYDFPNQFNIAVKEYPIVAYRQTGNGYMSILESGKTGGTVSTGNLPDKFITLKIDDDKKIEELVKELNQLDAKIKNNIQIINLTPTKATSDLLTIELYDGNTIRVPLSQLTTKLPYYQKNKNIFQMGLLLIWKLVFIRRLRKLKHQNLKNPIRIKRKIKTRLIVKKPVLLLKKGKSQNRLYKVLERILIPKVQVTKEKVFLQ
ncbi:Cell division protein FtsQ [Streptococcus sp. HSISS3]|nr:Cell division protein FtsQ [Streptococcus sp. HSISS3]